MASKRLTQRDIARMANVSQSTVSLVLNNAPASLARIPADTRDRVLKVIRETGYVADPAARSMVQGRNSILGVFTYEPAFPSEQADFFAPFLFGIEQAAQKLGYDLLMFTRTPVVGGGKKIFEESNRLRLADGCIVLGREFDRAELARLVAEDFPFVAIGRRNDAGGKVPYVGADYVAATADLVRLAGSLGHRRIAYVGPSGGPEATVDRWKGLTTALEGRPLTLHEPRVGLDPVALLEAVRESGASLAMFTELADAIPFRRAALAAGLEVPGDLSIIVLGSHIRPSVTGVQFTTYSLPREAMGQRATEMLAGLIEGTGSEEQILLDCQRVEGETLGRPKTI